MEIKIESTISEETYNQALEFDNFNLYHSQRWHNVLKYSFSWHVSSLSLYDNSNLVLFFPFVVKKRFNFKNYTVVLPLSHKIGPAYNKKYEEKIFHHNDVFKDFNNLEIHDDIKASSLKNHTGNTVITTDLTKYETLDLLFDALDKSSIQRKIKKAERENVKADLATDLDSFEEFAHLQSITRKKQGSPAYPKAFFENLWKQFKNTDQINLHLAYHKNKPVAGVIFSNFKKNAIYLYGASLDNRELYRIGINQKVMWEAIKHAYNNSCEIVDFGKTPYSLKSLERYKLKWAGKSEKLTYSYSKDTAIPNIDRESTTMTLASNILQKIPFNIFVEVSPYLMKLIL